ncbi:MAG: N(5)-(carboxyethyl)ornithine synthase [Clostridia bacterium]|nr:N(5)-(carboxyethyl)ornithine synthase [Clostridia bacterium]
MNCIGFPINDKENENRRALIPEHLANIKNVNCLYFEKGYGDVLGYSDSDYEKMGAHIVDRKTVLSKPIICDPKIGDAGYLNELKNQTLFGWVHAVQNRDITDILINNKLSAYCWEDMHDRGRHVFWRNNEIAGEAAIMHAFQCFGLMPKGSKVALIGRGNVSSGALRILTLLGADVTIYSRNVESLFRDEFSKYDVIVNALLWDVYRKDHLIYREDLKKMKKNSMIIDISCDRAGAIESSIPTTIENPYYYVDGVFHYVVDHTPSLVYKTTSKAISVEVAKYIDLLVEGKENNILKNAKCMENGQIIDKRINDFQNR